MECSLDYFMAEIFERERMSKTLSKYIEAFDCGDKILLALSNTNGSVSIASFATVFTTMHQLEQQVQILENWNTSSGNRN